jgi:hypothetical protein
MSQVSDQLDAMTYCEQHANRRRNSSPHLKTRAVSRGCATQAAGAHLHLHLDALRVYRCFTCRKRSLARAPVATWRRTTLELRKIPVFAPRSLDVVRGAQSEAR